MNKPAEEEGEDIKHSEPEWKDLSVPTVRRSAGKLYLQTNLVSVPLQLFLLLDFRSGHPQQRDDKRPPVKLKFTVTLNLYVPVEALVFNSVAVALLLLGPHIVVQSPLDKY